MKPPERKKLWYPDWSNRPDQHNADAPQPNKFKNNYPNG